MHFQLLATATLLLFSLAAHADTIFYLTGSLADGESYSGTLNWTPSGGILNGATFTYIDVSTSGGYSYTGAISTAPDSGMKETSGRYPYISLITDSSLSQDSVMSKSFSGTFLCGTAELCGDETGSQYTPGGPYYGAVSTIGSQSVANGIISSQPGSTTGTTVTPESSSFALLGTGLLGVTGVIRKRLA